MKYLTLWDFVSSIPGFKIQQRIFNYIYTNTFLRLSLNSGNHQPAIVKTVDRNLDRRDPGDLSGHGRQLPCLLHHQVKSWYSDLAYWF